MEASVTTSLLALAPHHQPAHAGARALIATPLEQPDGRRKAHLISALIPSGCESILDVGGGTGWLTLGLRHRFHVVTLDMSMPSLLVGSDERVVGDASRLPFGDAAFDIVLSSEMLEHLPPGVFDNARRELARVARRFLIVTVPYREDLAARLVWCRVCRHVFHADQHLQAFDERALARLFPGWTLAEWLVFGVLDEAAGVSPGFMRARLRASPPRWPAQEGSICPRCGATGSPSALDSNVIKPPTRALPLRVLRRLLPAPAPVVPSSAGRPYWIAGTYLPRGSASTVDVEAIVRP
jgi:SAM-dependent methyltransferase